jgi:hypothetical protein
LTGKAEAGSAGEQLARNNLSDWNGQWGGNFFTALFFDEPFQEFYAFKKFFHCLSRTTTLSIKLLSANHC